MGRYAKATDLQNGPTNGDVVSTPLPIKLLSLASPPRYLKGMKSGRPCDHKPSKPGLSCKTKKYGDAGTGGPGVLTANEILVMSARLWRYSPEPG